MNENLDSAEKNSLLKFADYLEVCAQNPVDPKALIAILTTQPFIFGFAIPLLTIFVLATSNYVDSFHEYEPIIREYGNIIAPVSLTIAVIQITLLGYWSMDNDSPLGLNVAKGASELLHFTPPSSAYFELRDVEVSTYVIPTLVSLIRKIAE